MEKEVILAASVTLLLLVVIIIVFLAIFQTRKNKYIKAERQFEDEIAKSQMEIREQALKNLSWELHDNVGQLLSIAKIHLNILHAKIDEDHKQEVLDTNNLIGESLSEIRLLSKALNPEIIHGMGLIQSIQLELERFNKLKFLKSELIVEGKEKRIENKDKIIIFRILQEFFCNVIKHSQAHSLMVKLEYLDEKLLITTRDDGVGFEPEKIVQGSGLLNMKSRSHLIGANFEINTNPGEGVTLNIEYPFRT